MCGILHSQGIPLKALDYHKPTEHIFHAFIVDLINWNPLFIILILDASLPAMANALLGFQTGLIF